MGLLITIPANRVSRKSETALLREELARLAAENRELREIVSRLEATLGRRVAALEAENDRLRLEIDKRDRRMAKYENPHSKQSSGSLYNERRTVRPEVGPEAGPSARILGQKTADPSCRTAPCPGSG